MATLPTLRIILTICDNCGAYKTTDKKCPRCGYPEDIQVCEKELKQETRLEKIFALAKKYELDAKMEFIFDKERWVRDKMAPPVKIGEKYQICGKSFSDSFFKEFLEIHDGPFCVISKDNKGIIEF